MLLKGCLWQGKSDRCGKGCGCQREQGRDGQGRGNKGIAGVGPNEVIKKGWAA